MKRRSIRAKLLDYIEYVEGILTVERCHCDTGIRYETVGDYFSKFVNEGLLIVTYKQKNNVKLYTKTRAKVTRYDDDLMKDVVKYGVEAVARKLGKSREYIYKIIRKTNDKDGCYNKIRKNKEKTMHLRKKTATTEPELLPKQNINNTNIVETRHEDVKEK